MTLNRMVNVLYVKLNHMMAIMLLVTFISLSVHLYADTATGTAFFVTSDGYALTCAHVVKDASKIELVIGEKTLNAAIITIDEKNDVALLKAEVTNQVTIPISNAGAIASGAKVWVLGFPLASVLGESLKVTSGTVSGIVVQGTQRIIQIDAAVNPGNSGGPLLNERGVVVGIVNAKIVDSDVSGVGFAIPTNYAMKLLRDQDLSPSSATTDTVLDGPALTKRATPAIALVRATVPLKEPKLIKSLPTGKCSSVSFSKDGKTVVCAGNTSNKATIWDIATGNVVQSFVGITKEDFKPNVIQEAVNSIVDHPLLMSATFSPDGRFVVGNAPFRLMVWDVGTGKRVNTLDSGMFGGAYAFTADGLWLLNGIGVSGKEIQCISTKNSEETTLGTGDCAGISISPIGNIVAVCYGKYTDSPHTKGTVEILDLPSGKLLRKITGSRAYIEAVDYSPDGRLIAGCEIDTTSKPSTLTNREDPTGVITIWDSTTGSVVKTIQCPGMSPGHLQYSPDGKLLAVGITEAKRYSKGEASVEAIWLYDTVTFERFAILPGSFSFGVEGDCQIFSPDSKYLALCGSIDDQNIKIWQIR